MLLGLPDDVLLCVMELLAVPYALSATCTRTAQLWRGNYGTIRQQNAAPPRFLRVALRGTVRPTVLGVSLFSDVSGYRRALSRIDPSRLRHLIVRLNDGGSGVLVACRFAQQCGALCSFKVTAHMCHISDATFTCIPLSLSPSLSSLCIRVPMNSLTLAGLSSFVDGLLRHGSSLRSVELDVSGNWIRGTEYGGQLARVAGLPNLLQLGLTFGGQAAGRGSVRGLPPVGVCVVRNGARRCAPRRRRQFGLQDLSLLATAHTLRRLTLHIIGAKLTSNFFKRALLGVVSLPRLEELSLPRRSLFLAPPPRKPTGLRRGGTVPPGAGAAPRRGPAAAPDARPAGSHSPPVAGHRCGLPRAAFGAALPLGGPPHAGVAPDRVPSARRAAAGAHNQALALARDVAEVEFSLRQAKVFEHPRVALSERAVLILDDCAVDGG
jgi:hypothetical protein